MLAEFYNNKGVYYIQIGTHSVLATGARRPRKQPCGFYHLGSDPAKLGTRRFDGYMLIRFRAKQIRSEPVYNYGLQATLKYQPTISSSTFSNFNLEENENQTFPPI